MLFSVVFVVTIASAVAFRGIRASSIINVRGEATAMKAVQLEDLPYEYDALEPHISSRTLHFHHDKHHAKYVAVTNDMIKGTEMEADDLVTIVRKAHGKNQGLFNNAGQVFNHDFYWKSMKPGGGGRPKGRLAELINKHFGSYEKFREDFVKAAMTAFGSGWAWLVWTPSGLKISQTIGAGNPLTEEGSVPLLTVDVWEHAYYLDYQNLRQDYVDKFMDFLVDWDSVSSRLPTNA